MEKSDWKIINVKVKRKVKVNVKVKVNSRKHPAPRSANLNAEIELFTTRCHQMVGYHFKQCCNQIGDHCIKLICLYKESFSLSVIMFFELP